jgi:hypothetical protein
MAKFVLKGFWVSESSRWALADETRTGRKLEFDNEYLPRIGEDVIIPVGKYTYTIEVRGVVYDLSEGRIPTLIFSLGEYRWAKEESFGTRLCADPMWEECEKPKSFGMYPIR